MELKPWTMYWFFQGQKKEHLNRMQECNSGRLLATLSECNTNTNEWKMQY